MFFYGFWKLRIPTFPCPSIDTHTRSRYYIHIYCTMYWIIYVPNLFLSSGVLVLAYPSSFTWFIFILNRTRRLYDNRYRRGTYKDCLHAMYVCVCVCVYFYLMMFIWLVVILMRVILFFQLNSRLLPSARNTSGTD